MLVQSLLLACGAAIGSVWMWARNRASEKEHRAAERKALSEAQDARVQHRYLERRVALRDTQLARAEKQRDDYAAIASTHEIRTPRWRAGEWVRKVWKDRRFSGHPRENLADLRTDFAAFDDAHVMVSMDIELLGGWKALFGGDPRSGITTPLSTGRTLLFEGPSSRVLEQIVTFVCDDDTGFLSRQDDNEADREANSDDDSHALVSGEDVLAGRRWRDEDSPMVWTLTVDVMESGGANNVEFVEVLRVQEELVEVVVEKPVLRTVPPDVASSLAQHTKEEIVSLIEAVLEVRELELPGRLVAERKALPADLGGSPEVEGSESPPASNAGA